MDLHQARPGLDDLRAARAPGHPHLRHRLRLREPARHRPLLPHAVPRRGVPEDDGHGRVSLPRRQVPRGARGRRRAARARSLLAAAYRCGVPIFTSSPGDSSIGMNLAALQLEGSQAAHRPAARREPDGGHRLGREEDGGTQRRVHPRRRLAQELHPADRAADSGSARPGGERATTTSCKFTDARPDTGGLCGATPQEAMTWGKVDPEQAARHGDLLRRFDRVPAAADGLRPGHARAAQAAAPDGPARRFDEATREGLRGEPEEASQGIGQGIENGFHIEPRWHNLP